MPGEGVWSDWWNGIWICPRTGFSAWKTRTSTRSDFYLEDRAKTGVTPEPAPPDCNELPTRR